MHTQLNEALIQLKLENYNSHRNRNLNVILEVVKTSEPKSKIISIAQNSSENTNDKVVKSLLNTTLSVFKRRRSA